MKIAIVTGASSGLGSEFVRQIRKQEKLDEIWVIARRKDRLMTLEKELRTHLRIITGDLTKPETLREIEAMLWKEKPDVRILVNAAGYGKIGSWRDIKRVDVDGMIDLNCKAAVAMTQISLPFMKRGARILQICSTAAFQPFQYLSVYAATKAFLYRYSRALRVELYGTGIRVTAVCPYWIKDTEFIGRAKRAVTVLISTVFRLLPDRKMWRVMHCWMQNLGWQYPHRVSYVPCTGQQQRLFQRI